MRSLLFEFHRFNDLRTGDLREGDPYLIAAASQPVRQFPLPIGHADFLDLMIDLRYQSGAAARETALKTIGPLVTSILNTSSVPDLESGEFPLQLDLVVNAAELAALPFEAVMDGAGQPLLVQAERPIELTRRVRHGFAESGAPWPARPRVLFVWASPPGVNEVPHEAHLTALCKALERWLPIQDEAGSAPDLGGVLTTLPEASLAKLTEVCAASATAPEGAFTHVHILAHGYPVGRAHRARFGMALHAADGDLDAVLPEAITEALAPLKGRTVVVTLATCDAANVTNTLIPEKSIAHELHVAGFPVVVASQLPLTVPGSNLMVERFYRAVVAGGDVRTALHDARRALYDNRARTGHDWVSLVGYVRLPEGYAEHLKEVRLRMALAALNTVQKYSDKLVQRADASEAHFEGIAQLLGERIEELETFLRDPSKRPEVLGENRGLLGSSEKRLAENHFERFRRFGGDDRRQAMHDALRRSRDWYRQEYQANLSNHWAGVQYLALEAVLDGRIEDQNYWYAAVAAARIACANPKEYWAQGSLLELHLLAPLAAQPFGEDAASATLAQLKERVASCASDRFPLESTERQLRRYTSWWTNANGFFPRRADLSREAERLIQTLRS